MKRVKATLPMMWRITRRTSMVVGLAVMLALVVGIVSPALAVKATNFVVNQTNNATAKSSLVASIADPVLSLVNNGAGAALNLQVPTGKAPMTVSADSAKVDNLDADMVDGKHATDLAGVQGPAGPKGDTGVAGPAGPSGFSNLRRFSKFVSLAGNRTRNEFTVTCDDASHPGSKAISGGYNPNSGPIVTAWSYPSASTGSWEVGAITVEADNGTPINGTVFALCADAAG